jgi:hypothetical protein
MAFNVKSKYALLVRDEVLKKPPGKRNGFTGFWVASLKHIEKETTVRIAYMPKGLFVLEADIDHSNTRRMQEKDLDVYVRHENLKQKGKYPREKLEKIVRRCIRDGRIVIAFRNARSIVKDMNHSGRNPVWYTRNP